MELTINLIALLTEPLKDNSGSAVDIWLKVFIGVFGLINAFLAIYLPYKARITESRQKKEAAEREAAQIIAANKRDEELDKKLGLRLQVVITELDNNAKLLNEVNDKVVSTAKLLSEHIKEGSLKANFQSVYWFQVNQITHFWNSRDEKFKVIFDYWTDSIEGLALAFIENKTKKNKHPFEEFHPIEIMERIVIDFYRRADSLIDESISNMSFSRWLEAKNIHGKSKVIANELEANGMSEDQFINKMKNYIYNFGSLFTQACDLWMIEIDKKKNVA